VVGLVAPEVLPAFAFNQLFAAVEIRNEYNSRLSSCGTENKISGFWQWVKNIGRAVKKSFSLDEIKEDESGGGDLHPEWTLAHGFFVVMGGIRLVEPAKKAKEDVAFEAKKDDVPEKERGLACETTVKPRGRVTILTKEMLGPVLAKGIEINVTEDEIANTAKGDALSKTIFVVQSSWFVVQCITRAVQGLALTELELTTLALASLNGITLLLWWKKPLGAQTVVLVYPPDELREEERATMDRTNGVSVSSCFTVRAFAYIPDCSQIGCSYFPICKIFFGLLAPICCFGRTPRLACVGTASLCRVSTRSAMIPPIGLNYHWSLDYFLPWPHFSFFRSSHSSYIWLTLSVMSC
jgi:hypothetical protein